MSEIITRNYLEIKSINALNESISPKLECSINHVKPDDFQINKFFYKNVGKKHRWTDRLIWSRLVLQQAKKTSAKSFLSFGRIV